MNVRFTSSSKDFLASLLTATASGVDDNDVASLLLLLVNVASHVQLPLSVSAMCSKTKAKNPAWMKRQGEEEKKKKQKEICKNKTRTDDESWEEEK